MSTLHLIEGPVGAGKSTYAAQLGIATGAAHLNLDEWMVTLFRPDRPESDFLAWYSERKERCIEQIWLVALELLYKGNAVILELGLVQKAAREAFYSRVDGSDFELKVYWLDTPQDTRWQRVQARNAQSESDPTSTLKMQVSEEVFKMADAAWQEPDSQECADRQITIINQ